MLCAKWRACLPTRGCARFLLCLASSQTCMCKGLCSLRTLRHCAEQTAKDDLAVTPRVQEELEAVSGGTL